MIGQSAYNAVWRWHFYAGLMVMPFLVLLAVTGGLYLFQAPLTHAIYHDWENVVPGVGQPMAASAVVARTEELMDTRVIQVEPPALPTQSYRMTLRTMDGRSHWAFMNPWNGALLGVARYGGIMQLVRKIHSLQYFGFWASCLIEVAAGWSVILVGSGVYLWWPRGRGGGVVSVRGRPQQRVFWRDLHAVTGCFAAAVIVFLAVTGMPWSLGWGAKVQQWTTQAGWGEPRPPAQTVPTWLLGQDGPPGMAAHHHHEGQVQAAALGAPWALEKAVVPQSATVAAQRWIGVDRAIEIVRGMGVAAPFTVTLPSGPRGAYEIDSQPGPVGKIRSVFLDIYDGHMLGDVGFRDFGPAAKAIEWGIAMHTGQEYGPLNLALMLAGCVCIVLLAVSSLVMWWKRRPKGSFGVPPRAVEVRHAQAVLVCMLPVAVIYPLVGASLLVALAVDGVLFGAWRRPFVRMG